jgi:N-acetylneuraminic acid mutarotase
MGGYTSQDGTISTNYVYTASLRDLATKPHHSSKPWTESQLSLKYCTPLSFNGSLYAVGGEATEEKRESAMIQRYDPDSRKWIEVGMLHSPRSKCTCAVLEDGKIIVAGGNINKSTFLKTVEIYPLNL